MGVCVWYAAGVWWVGIHRHVCGCMNQYAWVLYECVCVLYECVCGMGVCVVWGCVVRVCVCCMSVYVVCRGGVVGGGYPQACVWMNEPACTWL